MKDTLAKNNKDLYTMTRDSPEHPIKTLYISMHHEIPNFPQ